MLEDAPEFYSMYRLTNQNNGKIYTDKFAINVLDLTKIELATAYDNKESFTEDLITTIYDATSDENTKLNDENAKLRQQLIDAGITPNN